jgi:hypothetical protein
MAADRAAMPFRKREAETAVETGKERRIKRGEKMRPPPRPTMVRTSELTKMIGMSRNQDISDEPRIRKKSFLSKTHEGRPPRNWQENLSLDAAS